ncbi:MAG: acylphosphatase [Verrucomicrobia bacterium]|nr:MAG: acylphosphatase [Verrucomicrobiota bacterium]
MIAKEIIFEGRVQGVGFRYTVKDLARGFDVCGTVQNLPDGSVKLYLIGEATEVDQMIHEIMGESNVAHHIRNSIVRDAAIDHSCQRFSIIR